MTKDTMMAWLREPWPQWATLATLLLAVVVLLLNLWFYRQARRERSEQLRAIDQRFLGLPKNVQLWAIENAPDPWIRKRLEKLLEESTRN